MQGMAGRINNSAFIWRLQRRNTEAGKQNKLLNKNSTQNWQTKLIKGWSTSKEMGQKILRRELGEETRGTGETLGRGWWRAGVQNKAVLETSFTKVTMSKKIVEARMEWATANVGIYIKTMRKKVCIPMHAFPTFPERPPVFQTGNQQHPVVISPS